MLNLAFHSDVKYATKKFNCRFLCFLVWLPRLHWREDLPCARTALAVPHCRSMMLTTVVHPTARFPPARFFGIRWFRVHSFLAHVFPDSLLPFLQQGEFLVRWPFVHLRKANEWKAMNAKATAEAPTGQTFWMPSSSNRFGFESECTNRGVAEGLSSLLARRAAPSSSPSTIASRSGWDRASVRALCSLQLIAWHRGNFPFPAPETLPPIQTSVLLPSSGCLWAPPGSSRRPGCILSSCGRWRPPRMSANVERRASSAARPPATERGRSAPTRTAFLSSRRIAPSLLRKNLNALKFYRAPLHLPLDYLSSRSCPWICCTKFSQHFYSASRRFSSATLPDWTNSTSSFSVPCACFPLLNPLLTESISSPGTCILDLL